jgi:hypothetical protein
VSQIPTSVLSDKIGALVSNRRVRAAAFLTYQLEPAFFETEVAALFLTAPGSSTNHRLLQLETALTDDIGPIAVYYDPKGLEQDGSPRLAAIRKIPITVKSGVFHPKVLLLLTEPRTSNAKSAKPELSVCVMSANLTRNGWWKNLECVYIETAAEGERFSLRDDVLSLVKSVRGVAKATTAHDALDIIEEFTKGKLSGFETASHRMRLRPRLLAGFDSLASGLSDMRLDWLKNRTLEVISPFFDKEEPKAIQELIKQFEPEAVRVFLPKNAEGVAQCPPEIYDAVAKLPKTKWAKLPEALLRVSSDKSLGTRNVHAKVYRFVDKPNGYQAVVLGSHNATSAAHQLARKRGNFEASIITEPDDSHSLEPWLEVDGKRPSTFAQELMEERVDGEGELDVVPLEMIFDWDTGEGRACWRGGKTAAALALKSAGILLATVEPLKPDLWTVLPESTNTALSETLKHTSMLSVDSADGQSGLVLVQEENAHKKPNLFTTMTVATILEFWSQLSPEQQATFIEARFGDDAEQLQAAVTDGARLSATSQSMFDNFAGIYHGFEMLRRQVHSAIAADRLPKVSYLLFGERHDSLPTALALTIENRQGQGPVERYVFMLCARQLLTELRTSYPKFWAANSAELERILALCTNTDAVKTELKLGEDGAKFLTWFEKQFAHRASAPSRSTEA